MPMKTIGKNSECCLNLTLEHSEIDIFDKKKDMCSLVSKYNCQTPSLAQYNLNCSWILYKNEN